MRGIASIKEVGVWYLHIHGFNPRKEVKEVRLDEGQEGISRYRIECIFTSRETSIYRWVCLKECCYCVVGNVSAVTATDTYLDWPR